MTDNPSEQLEVQAEPAITPESITAIIRTALEKIIERGGVDLTITPAQGQITINESAEGLRDIDVILETIRIGVSQYSKPLSPSIKFHDHEISITDNLRIQTKDKTTFDQEKLIGEGTFFADLKGRISLGAKLKTQHQQPLYFWTKQEQDHLLVIITKDPNLEIGNAFSKKTRSGDPQSRYLLPAEFKNQELSIFQYLGLPIYIVTCPGNGKSETSLAKPEDYKGIIEKLLREKPLS